MFFVNGTGFSPYITQAFQRGFSRWGRSFRRFASSSAFFSSSFSVLFRSLLSPILFAECLHERSRWRRKFFASFAGLFDQNAHTGTMVRTLRTGSDRSDGQAGGKNEFPGCETVQVSIKQL